MPETQQGLPDYLQHFSSTEKSFDQQVDELVAHLKEFVQKKFGSYSKMKEFVEAFREAFPAGTSYPQDESIRLSPQSIEENQVACNMAALIFGCWLEEYKQNHQAYFLVKRGKRRNHTMVGVIKKNGEEKESATESFGKVSRDIKDIAAAKEDLRIVMPQLGYIFTSVHDLAKYLILDQAY